MELAFGSAPLNFNLGNTGPGRASLQVLQELRQGRSWPFRHHFDRIAVLEVSGPANQAKVLSLALGVVAERNALHASHYQNA